MLCFISSLIDFRPPTPHSPSSLPPWTTSAMSPFKQRAVHNLFRNYIFNGYRRLSSQAVYWVIPFALGTYCILIFTLVIVYHPSWYLTFRCRLRHLHVGQALRRMAKQQGGACRWSRRPLSFLEHVYTPGRILYSVELVPNPFVRGHSGDALCR